MSDDTDLFAEPESTADDWVDVRMTDPHVGEWDIDVVVANGQVEYVDLRVHPEQVAAFLSCLVSDVPDEDASQMLEAVADGLGVELNGRPD
ncbi:hypothetical protein VB773_08100 [Haloarculaceae archaeon H-GB2-1]|nr:hypothetical protein [Haloarculaceae archaeon H-GB1-1]MEA5386025.1 hypothetical protein [Haloarculaceae archaeon H-GB11]MEA5407530.1 hypothetical protein [Haloarculaceae archaeon H-GB2-1]